VSSSPTRLTPPVVLVVDDDPDVHGFLTTFLTAKGHSVKTASHVEDGIQQLRSGGVDAVVLDVKMPGRSGLDLLSYVRAIPGLQKLPVLILTGAPLSPEEEVIVASGRAYVFYKQEGDLDEFASYLERLTRAA
jgi:DNA-binding response OmpR family regulator